MSPSDDTIWTAPADTPIVVDAPPEPVAVAPAKAPRQKKPKLPKLKWRPAASPLPEMIAQCHCEGVNCERVVCELISACTLMPCPLSQVGADVDSASPEV